MHLSVGELRAYHDRELDERAMEAARAHLAACPRCQERVRVVVSRAETLAGHFERLSSLPEEEHLSARHALARFNGRYPSKEKQTMVQKIFAKPYRPAWIGLGIVAILAIALAFQPVQAIANSFLGLFRVQQIHVVQINPGDLPEQLGSSSQFEYLIANDVQIDEIGESQVVQDAAEASGLASIPVRLPTGIEGLSELVVQPGTRVSLRVDLQKIRTLLAEVGREDIELPDALDGALVTMELPRAVTASYGECEFNSEAAREAGIDPDDPGQRMPDCTTLVQMQSPEITAPPGLDVAGLGEAFLVVMGMPEEDAEHFSQQIDWTTTLVLPIPRYGTEYRDVSVDGVNGTLIQQSMEEHAPEYLLLWVREGVLYALTGAGNISTALNIANSLE